MPLGPSDVEAGAGCDGLLCGGQEEDSRSCVVADIDGDELGPDDPDVSIAEFIAGEAAYSPGTQYPDRLRSGSTERFVGRSESVAWILKVRSYYGFRPVTAYLAVNYMDRFLSSHSLPDLGWAFQLLSVACLSLAAKMEETLVPPLLDLQIDEGTRFFFEPRTVRRMELLVLTALDWRLRSVTPFTFIDFFAYKADSSGKYTTSLVSRASQITLDMIHGIEFLDHCPSSMAAAAILRAVNETPALACVSPEIAASWCIGLTEEGISSCYQAMQQLALSTAKREHPFAAESNSSIKCEIKAYI